jgi:hypothetical protein
VNNAGIGIKWYREDLKEIIKDRSHKANKGLFATGKFNN